MRLHLVLAFGLALAPLPALAHTPLAEDSVTTRVGDLDLSTPAGQRVFNARLNRAAKAVCSPGIYRIHLSMQRKANECRAEVIADARARVTPGTEALVISTAH
ncbi:UrcA family protein [Sphingomonas zeicaulis]|uniref:UrcA family protein n=1 Tax=Sphingomonas zeicaulis TaxID=1632740 RepID=UPI003D1F5E03